MKCDADIFILDAKYYKFGVTGYAAHLPATSSIQKQITYGEYVVARHFADKDKVFNAFIMPFEARAGEEPLKCASIATADWVEYSADTENFKYVLGLLLDTKYIINNFVRHNGSEILRVSKLIMESLKSFRNNT